MQLRPMSLCSFFCCLGFPSAGTSGHGRRVGKQEGEEQRVGGFCGFVFFFCVFSPGAVDVKLHLNESSCPSFSLLAGWFMGETA